MPHAGYQLRRGAGDSVPDPSLISIISRKSQATNGRPKAWNLKT